MHKIKPAIYLSTDELPIFWRSRDVAYSHMAPHLKQIDWINVIAIAAIVVPLLSIFVLLLSLW